MTIAHHLLLNNTSHYHKGCVKVVEHLYEKYSITESRYTRDLLDDIDWSKYTYVTLNGEGTMHHSGKTSIRLLTALRKAQEAGCVTQLVNSVWQEMTNEFDDVLHKLTRVHVREVYSQQELKRKHGVYAMVRPDASYYVDVPVHEYKHVPVYEGQYMIAHKHRARGKYPRIDIFTQEWTEIVNRLRNCDLLITGRHHEMYAACVAECRFLVTPGNTWKNEGLLKSAGVTIPFDIEAVRSGHYDEEYQKLWDYLKKFKKK